MGYRRTVTAVTVLQSILPRSSGLCSPIVKENGNSKDYVVSELPFSLTIGQQRPDDEGSIDWSTVTAVTVLLYPTVSLCMESG